MLPKIARIGVLLAALVVSFIAADTLQRRLDVWIGAGEEFAVVRVLVAAWSLMTVAVFAIAQWRTDTTRAFDRLAIALSGFLAVLVIVAIAAEMASTRSLAIPGSDLALLTAVAAPLLLVVLVQWSIVRAYRISGRSGGR